MEGRKEVHLLASASDKPERSRESQIEEVKEQERFLEALGIPPAEASSLATKIARRVADPLVDVTALIEVATVIRSGELDFGIEEIRIGVERTFSDSETLQCSFYDNGNFYSKAEIELVHKFYKAVLSLRDDKILKTIISQTNSILFEYSTQRDNFSSPDLTLLILLLNPALQDIENHHTLIEILRNIRNIQGTHKHNLIRRLQTLKRDEMKLVLEILQQILTIRLYSGHHLSISLEDIFEGHYLSEDLRNILEVLSLLFESNKVSMAVPYDFFYNSVVNSDDFDIDNDYHWWRDKKPSNEVSFCNFPFIYDSGSKSQIMQLENKRLQKDAFEGALWSHLLGIPLNDGNYPFFVISVRRGPDILQETIFQIQKAKRHKLLQCPLKVKFIDEEAVDEGGVAKEFFQLILRKLFDPNYGMFFWNEDTRVWWFRASQIIDQTQEFELAGILLGLAIFNHHILDLSFPLVVYKKLLGHNATCEDLEMVYPDIYKSLNRIKKMSEEELAALELTFEIEQDDGMGCYAKVDLLSNGASISVNTSNRSKFILLYSMYLLDMAIKERFESFKSGFLSICHWKSLQMFMPEELEQAICGKQILDTVALEKATQYQDGFSPSSKVVKWFWEVVHAFTDEKKKKLLQFVTGSDRIPIRGFSSLDPKFTISRWSSSSSNRLPVAHTCFNHLLVPEYRDKQSLKARLETAIENSEGFGLM